jgi:hypothetical protein
MPWRSNTGVPFGNTNVDSPEGSEGSEASGFSGGAEFVEHQPELFGDLFDGTMDAEEGSAVDLQQVFPEAGAESHMGHNVAAAEPGRKRLGPSMDLDEGAGPDKRLFQYAGVTTAGSAKDAMGHRSCCRCIQEGPMQGAYALVVDAVSR